MCITIEARNFSSNQVTFKVRNSESLPCDIINTIDEIYELQCCFPKEVNAIIALLDGSAPINPEVRVLYYWDDQIDHGGRGTVVFTVSNCPVEPRIFLSDLSILYGWRYEKPSFIHLINNFVNTIDPFRQVKINFYPLK